MSWVAAAIAGSSVLGAITASNAADTQAQAAANASALQQQNFNTINAQQAPGRASGYSALNTIGSMMPGQQQTYDAQGNPIGTQQGTGYLTNQFGAADLNANLAPNYAFQLGQGQQATNAQSNATGGLVGGNAMKGLQDYTQNYASGAYQNAFNNYQSQRTGIYNTLAGIAGLGQTAQAQTNTAGTNAANAMGQASIGGAAATAAGQIGVANQLGSGLTGAANQNYLANLLNTNPSATSAASANSWNVPTQAQAAGNFASYMAAP